MTELISAIEAVDVRFPTSRELDGSDAMNPEPDYAAAYVTACASNGAEGHGLAFTVGRGNGVEVAAVGALVPLVVGLPVDKVLGDPGGLTRRLSNDSQLRWLGPEKGAIHMAAAAMVNAVWDLYGRREGKPVWRLLAEMYTEQLVNLVGFRYLEDALTRDESQEILHRAETGRVERTAHPLEHGYPSPFAAIVIGGISLNGGTGTVFGVFTGILLLLLIQNVLALGGVPAQWIGALKGAIILIALTLSRVTGGQSQE